MGNKRQKTFRVKMIGPNYEDETLMSGAGKRRCCRDETADNNLSASSLSSGSALRCIFSSVFFPPRDFVRSSITANPDKSTLGSPARKINRKLLKQDGKVQRRPGISLRQIEKHYINM